jgi:hypothetical protein
LRGEAPQGPHSLVFARLASGAFYAAIISAAFCGFNNPEAS